MKYLGPNGYLRDCLSHLQVRPRRFTPLPARPFYVFKNYELLQRHRPLLL